MFRKVLVANRGEIACASCARCGAWAIGSVAVYSEADAGALHVGDGDEAVAIGGASAARELPGRRPDPRGRDRTGAEAIHPGYGFLSENAEFAARCEAAGIAFIGPTPEQMRAFGLKHAARELATKAGLPLLPGTELLASVAQARRAAKRIGYPVMLKSTAGGGGIGMRRCADGEELAAGVRRGRAPGREPLQRRRASTWRSSSSPRATSRCRSSATGGGGCWRSASATARCSGATRR